MKATSRVVLGDRLEESLWMDSNELRIESRLRCRTETFCSSISLAFASKGFLMPRNLRLLEDRSRTRR